MFGVSFSEVVLVAVVALLVAGPRRLPEMLGTVGEWIGRLRRMTTEVRRQTGIDEILRQEGLPGGIHELRAMMRGDLAGAARTPLDQRPARPADPTAVVDAYGEALHLDRYREFPVEGPDTYGAIPEDLVGGLVPDAPEIAPPEPAPPAPRFEPPADPRNAPVARADTGVKDPA